MTIYHLEVKTYGRNRGGDANAIKAAAYRAGMRMRNAVTGRMHDYSGKSEVVHTEILAPHQAPEWIADRARLWHAVETAERYKNARLFREIVVALPLELTLTENIALLRDFVTAELTPLGMVVDYAVHAKPGNPHCHLSCPTRVVTGAGFTTKNRGWDSKTLVIRWRKAWAETVNRHLAQAGFGPESFIDHRSLQDQGMDRLPTIHVGRATPDAMTSHARKTAYNRLVEQINDAKAVVARAAQLDVLRDDIGALEGELAAAEASLANHLTGASARDRLPCQARLAPPQRTAAPSTVPPWTPEEQMEFNARAAFVQALGKPPYTAEKFGADCRRMAAQPGGARLRWWLFTFKEAQTRYARAYGAALACVPQDIRSWMGQCWNRLQESGTWSQFATEESTQAARRLVPWPGDCPPASTISTAAAPVAAACTSSTAVTVPAATASSAVTIRCHHDGTLPMQRTHGPVDLQLGIALYSTDPGMRVFEMNVKSVVPDAELLFRERQVACRRLGERYTWQHFHRDILALQDASHRHQDMLDWWEDFYRSAKARGALQQEPQRSAVLNAMPPRIRQRLKARWARFRAGVDAQPADAGQPGNRATTVSDLGAACSAGSVPERAMARCDDDPKGAGQTGKAAPWEIPRWEPPALVPPDIGW